MWLNIILLKAFNPTSLAIKKIISMQKLNQPQNREFCRTIA